jgi:hypothetical protein
MAWWSVVGLFRHTYSDARRVPRYEHRVVIVSAPDRDVAEAKVLLEFREYSEGEGIEFLEQWEVDSIIDELGDQVVEVASDMRVSALPARAYVKQYWENCPASCDEMGWTHIWFNLDGTRSGCYNCMENREGRLWEEAIPSE